MNCKYAQVISDTDILYFSLGLAFAQDLESAKADKLIIALSKRILVTLLISENGCFLRREVSIAINQNKGEFFYAACTFLWKSDAKKGASIIPKKGRYRTINGFFEV